MFKSFKSSKYKISKSFGDLEYGFLKINAQYNWDREFRYLKS